MQMSHQPLSLNPTLFNPGKSLVKAPNGFHIEPKKDKPLLFKRASELEVQHFRSQSREHIRSRLLRFLMLLALSLFLTAGLFWLLFY